MTQKASLKFKEAWTFPEQVEKRISEFVKKHPGKWLHAPVGISKIALGPFDKTVQMTTFDKDPSVKPDIVGDIFKLSEYFGRNKFDGVISDPIWYTKEKNKSVGLAYHAGVSMVAGGLWALAVRYCWPSELDDDSDEPATTATTENQA